MDAVFHVVAGLRHVHAIVQALHAMVLDAQVLPHNHAIPSHVVWLIQEMRAETAVLFHVLDHATVKVFAALAQLNVLTTNIKLAQAAVPGLIQVQMQMVMVLMYNVKIVLVIMQQEFAIVQFQVSV